MSDNRIDQKLQALAQGPRKALVPYVTAGYPDLPTTGRIIEELDALGVPLVELGIPFSDSIADGPVIQGSFHEVLSRPFRTDDVFALVQSLRGKVSVGLLAMVSMSLVRRPGVDGFVARCAASGFDGLIVPDVPLEECEEVRSAAERVGLRCVMLVAPTTPVQRRERIANVSSGFIYQVAVRGITGERDAVPAEIADYVRQLRQSSALPVCVGFGISSPAHVRAVCRIADGAIVGSAIVRRIADAVNEGCTSERIVERVRSFVAELLEATVTA